MKLSNKTKFNLIAITIILNIILRIQVEPREIGSDSFLMHIMVNSLSEFGYAKWLLNPLSVFGLYPASYSSTMQFLISGISQSTNMGMNSTIFIYCILIGLISMFTAYLMAGEIVDDDLFKLLTAFGFSTSPALLGYTTWTMPARGLLIILAPLLIYLLLKCRKSVKFIPLTLVLIAFLSATHHLFYFLLPCIFSFSLIIIYLKYNNHPQFRFFKIPEVVIPLVIVIGFMFMFSIPFFTGRFIESSRYDTIYISYARYVGVLILPAIGGFVYLILKHNKNFGEWLLLLSLMFLTVFIYEQTYMKWFLPLLLIPLGCIGLINIIKLSKNRKSTLCIAIILIILSINLSGYYQFIHDYEESPYNERYIEDSTYNTGGWMKNHLNGLSTSNDIQLGHRIFSVSEGAHVLVSSTVINQIYGFVSINISEYERYPITGEDFWFSGYDGKDLGELSWENIQMQKPYNDLNITYIVENRKAKGNIIWNHGIIPSPILHYAYGKNLIYDVGNIYIWQLEDPDKNLSRNLQ